MKRYVIGFVVVCTKELKLQHAWKQITQVKRKENGLKQDQKRAVSVSVLKIVKHR